MFGTDNTVMMVADLIMVMMLGLSLDLVNALLRVTVGASRKKGPTRTPTCETYVAFNWLGNSAEGPLYGKRIGLVRLGGIGSLVATRARAFCMLVSYFRPSRRRSEAEAGSGVTLRPVVELAAEATLPASRS